VNLASVLDAAITQMRSKLEAKSVSVSRNYNRRPHGSRRRGQTLRPGFSPT